MRGRAGIGIICIELSERILSFQWQVKSERAGATSVLGLGLRVVSRHDSECLRVYCAVTTQRMTSTWICMTLLIANRKPQSDEDVENLQGLPCSFYLAVFSNDPLSAHAAAQWPRPRLLGNLRPCSACLQAGGGAVKSQMLNPALNPKP